MRVSVRSFVLLLVLGTHAQQTEYVIVTPSTGNFVYEGIVSTYSPSPSNLTGTLVFVGDNCQPSSYSLVGMIALILRGSCTFVTKTANAQSNGAVAAIIVNVEGAAILMGSGSSTNDITIPAISVAQWAGEALQSSTSAYVAGCDASCSLGFPAVCTSGSCASALCRNHNGSCATSGCSTQCQSRESDGACDSSCNTYNCNYDGSDCVASPPSSSSSPAPSPTHSEVCNCPVAFLGDNECDSFCNTSACNYDNGDCNVRATSAPVHYYHPPTTPQPISSQCTCPGSYIGDGECDQQCNTSACNYDNGDCVAIPTHDAHTCLCSQSMLGNGECDALCNTWDCSYDHGDCISSYHAGFPAWAIVLICLGSFAFVLAIIAITRAASRRNGPHLEFQELDEIVPATVVVEAQQQQPVPVAPYYTPTTGFQPTYTVSQ